MQLNTMTALNIQMILVALVMVEDTAIYYKTGAMSINKQYVLGDESS